MDHFRATIFCLGLEKMTSYQRFENEIPGNQNKIYYIPILFSDIKANKRGLLDSNPLLLKDRGLETKSRESRNILKLIRESP